MTKSVFKKLKECKNKEERKKIIIDNLDEFSEVEIGELSAGGEDYVVAYIPQNPHKFRNGYGPVENYNTKILDQRAACKKAKY